MTESQSGINASGREKATLVPAGLNRAFTLASAVAYVVLLRISYTAIIVPRYGYLGYWFVPPIPIVEAMFVGLALIPAAFLPLRLQRPSEFVLWFFYGMGIIPAVLFPLYSGVVPAIDAFVLALVFVACFLGLLATTRLPLARIPQLRIAPGIFWAGIVAGALVGVMLVRIVFGVGLTLPSISQVYQRRAEFKQTVGVTGSFAVYLTLWLANVIGPLLMAAALVNRRWGLGLLGVMVEFIVFSVSGFKSVLLTPVLLAATMWTLRYQCQLFGSRFMLGLTSLVAAGLVIDPLTPVNPITGAVVRRLIVTPGVLTGIYAQYFAVHPNTLLGYSILRGLVGDPSAQPPAITIGNYLAPGQGLVANTNFMADSLANFGLPGVVGVTIVLAGILWLYDSLFRGKQIELAVLLIAVPAFELSNTSLQTGIVTQGLGLAVVLAALIPHSNENRNKHAPPRSN